MRRRSNMTRTETVTHTATPVTPVTYSVMGYGCPRLEISAYSVHEAKRCYLDAYNLSRARPESGITCTEVVR